MASYTIEDIELIRKKSGISYQEAVALLDYHNGNVARALVDLERNGRIKPESQQKASSSSSGSSQHSRGTLSRLLSKFYRFRLKVKKGDIVIANLSLLFSLLALMVSPHLVIIAAILVLILGYRVSFDKNDCDFASANLEKMVRNAADNVKSTVSDFAKGFEDGFDREKNEPDTRKDAQQPAQEEKKDSRSFYQSNPAATTYHTAYTGSAPTIQVPVQVESQDGSVSVEDDRDGYTNATIE